MAEHPFIKQASDAIEKLANLRIVTTVGAGTWDAEADEYKVAADAKVAYSSLNLLTGDIATHIDPSFAGGEYDSLREFHLGREKEGAAIVHANVEALKQLILLARQLTTPQAT